MYHLPCLNNSSVCRWSSLWYRHNTDRTLQIDKEKIESNFWITGLSICEGNPPMARWFPTPRASNVESVSMSRLHHLTCQHCYDQLLQLRWKPSCELCDSDRTDFFALPIYLFISMMWQSVLRPCKIQITPVSDVMIHEASYCWEWNILGELGITMAPCVARPSAAIVLT